MLRLHFKALRQAHAKGAPVTSLHTLIKIFRPTQIHLSNINKPFNLCDPTSGANSEKPLKLLSLNFSHSFKGIANSSTPVIEVEVLKVTARKLK